jgi:MtN3 and saliva related transmembrane protein
MIETLVGSAAAVCTTTCYVPQLHKAWKTGDAGDVSLKMLLILAAGVGLWTIYGIIKDDFVIIVANGVSLTFVLMMIFFKLRSEHAVGI